MNTINDDVTVDGWLALCIAILCGCPQQEAFRKLDNPFGCRKWAEDDYLEMEYLRSTGLSWKAIGEIMRTNPSNVFRQYMRWKNGK